MLNNAAEIIWIALVYGAIGAFTSFIGWLLHRTGVINFESEDILR